MKEKNIAAQEYREMLINDPYRPTYHFAIPSDNGYIGDSNGAFYADGLYHLMYLYENSKTNGFHWGHLTSRDLLHWRCLPDALTTYKGDKGCYSGGAFLDDDGTAYITFWKFPAVEPKEDEGGIAMVCSKPPYEKWERIEPIVLSSTDYGITDIEVNGKTIHIGCADPSNIWKMNGHYYMQLGNLCVLNKYGREENAEAYYKGGWTELLRSDDLKNWEYVSRFYDNTPKGDDWPDESEDDMCPSFLPLYDSVENGNETGKYLQLFISHNKGCQYFVGELKGEKFIPEIHERMTWKDNAYFAPEALIDDKKRHIIWTWLHDDLPESFQKYGWCGVYGFPRCVWLENSVLHMAPAKELDRLQYNHQSFEKIENATVSVKNGESFRLKAKWNVGDGEKAGFKVRVSDDGSEYTEIYYDDDLKKLVMDISNGGIKTMWSIKEEAPFKLQNGEKLELDIFVDKSVVEVYANNRQAICRRVYPTNPKNSLGVQIIGDKEKLEKLDAYQMAATNMY